MVTLSVLIIAIMLYHSALEKSAGGKKNRSW